MKTLTSLLTLTLLLAHVSAASADWFYDFNDEVIPDTFKTDSYLLDSTIPSQTASASADGGVLGIWDTGSLSASNGGTYIARGFNEEVFDGDVRVTAEINPTGTTDDFLAVWSRVNTFGQGAYQADFSFYSSDPNSGRLYVRKWLPGNRNEYVRTMARVTDFSRSYFLEIEVTDDPVSGFPEITGRLLESEGGPVLLEDSFIDTNIGGIPPYTSGQAGVLIAAWGTNVLSAAFDNISAVSSAPLAWDRQGDGMWNDATHWESNEPERTPGAGTPVTIETDAVTVMADSQAGSLVIDHDGHLVVQKDATLVVARDVQIDNGTLELAAGGVLETKGEVRFDVGSQFVCQVGEESNGMVLSSTASGDIAISPGSSLQFQVSGASMFKAGFRTLMLTAGTNGITGEFETVSGLRDYVTGDWLSYDSGWLSLTIDKDLNPGDADLSTTTDLTDFNIWNANKFMSGTDWTTGDFNGDGTTDLSDFNIWNAAKFTTAGGGAAPAPTEVPEPGTLGLLIVGVVIGVVCWRRKRGRESLFDGSFGVW